MLLKISGMYYLFFLYSQGCHTDVLLQEPLMSSYVFFQQFLKGQFQGP